MVMKRELLRLLQSQLRGELRRRTRRRRNRSWWVVGGLILTIAVVSYLLHEPRAPLSDFPKGAELSCTIVSIYDGDTVTARCPSGQVRVRVFGIDAPEMKQEPWGTLSRDVLRGMVPRNEPIRLRVTDQDRYGRVVAKVLVGELDAGLELVRQGHAIVYRQFNNRSDYLQAEAEARRAKRGIWSQPGSHQDPAAWRRMNPG
jgi:micrococcal nuclease